MFLGLGPAFAVLVKAHGGIGQRRGAVGDCPRPRLLVAHGFGADRRGDVWCAAEHGVRQFALDPRTKAQRRQADARSRHHLQRIFGPVHHMKALGRVVQRGGLGRGVGTVDMQLGARQLLADQRPDTVLHPQHRIPVGRVAEVADAEEVRALVKRCERLGRRLQHQRAPVEQGGGYLELLGEQADLHVGDHQADVAAIDGCDLALGQVGVGHAPELVFQARCKQGAEVVVVRLGLEVVLEPLLACVA